MSFTRDGESKTPAAQQSISNSQVLDGLNLVVSPAVDRLNHMIQQDLDGILKKLLPWKFQVPSLGINWAARYQEATAEGTTHPGSYATIAVAVNTFVPFVVNAIVKNGAPILYMINVAEVAAPFSRAAMDVHSQRVKEAQSKHGKLFGSLLKARDVQAYVAHSAIANVGEISSSVQKHVTRFAYDNPAFLIFGWPSRLLVTQQVPNNSAAELPRDNSHGLSDAVVDDSFFVDGMAKLYDFLSQDKRLYDKPAVTSVSSPSASSLLPFISSDYNRYWTMQHLNPRAFTPVLTKMPSYNPSGLSSKQLLSILGNHFSQSTSNVVVKLDPSAGDLRTAAHLNDRLRNPTLLQAIMHPTSNVNIKLALSNHVVFQAELIAPLSQPSLGSLELVINIGVIGSINYINRLINNHHAEGLKKEAGKVEDRRKTFNNKLTALNAKSKEFSDAQQQNANPKILTEKANQVKELMNDCLQQAKYDLGKLINWNSKFEGATTDLQKFYKDTINSIEQQRSQMDNVLLDYPSVYGLHHANKIKEDFNQRHGNYQNMVDQLNGLLNNLVNGKYDDIDANLKKISNFASSDQVKNLIADNSRPIAQLDELLLNIDPKDVAVVTELNKIRNAHAAANNHVQMLLSLPYINQEQLIAIQAGIQSFDVADAHMDYFAKKLFFAQFQFVKKEYLPSLKVAEELIAELSAIKSRKLSEAEIEVVRQAASNCVNLNGAGQVKSSDNNIHLIRSIIDNNPASSASLVYSVSYLYFQSSLANSNEAVEWYKLCAAKDPKNALWQAFLGVATYNNFDWSEAEKYLDKAVELEPQNQVARSQIAIMAYQNFAFQSFKIQTFCYFANLLLNPVLDKAGDWLAEHKYVTPSQARTATRLTLDLVNFVSLPDVHQHFLLSFWPAKQQEDLEKFLKSKELLPFQSGFSQFLVATSLLSLVSKPFLSKTGKDYLEIKQTALDGCYRAAAIKAFSLPSFSSENPFTLLSAVETGFKITSLAMNISTLTRYGEALYDYGRKWTYKDGKFVYNNKDVLRSENRLLVGVESLGGSFAGKYLWVPATILMQNHSTLQTMGGFFAGYVAKKAAESSFFSFLESALTFVANPWVKGTLLVFGIYSLGRDCYNTYNQSMHERLVGNGDLLLTDSKFTEAISKYKEAKYYEHDPLAVECKIILAECKQLRAADSKDKKADVLITIKDKCRDQLDKINNQKPPHKESDKLQEPLRYEISQVYIELEDYHNARHHLQLILTANQDAAIVAYILLATVDLLQNKNYIQFFINLYKAIDNCQKLEDKAKKYENEEIKKYANEYKKLCQERIDDVANEIVARKTVIFDKLVEEIVTKYLSEHSGKQFQLTDGDFKGVIDSAKVELDGALVTMRDNQKLKIENDFKGAPADLLTRMKKKIDEHYNECKSKKFGTLEILKNFAAGLILQSDNKANGKVEEIEKPVLTGLFDHEETRFEEHVAKGDGRCGFYSIGVYGSDEKHFYDPVVNTLLACGIHEAARKELAKEIAEEIVAETTNPDINDRNKIWKQDGRVGGLIQKFLDEKHNPKTMQESKAYKDLLQACEDQTVYDKYVTAMKETGGWLGCKSAKLVAQYYKNPFSLVVWEKDEKVPGRIQIRQQDSYINNKLSDIKHIFYTNGYTHFNLLMKISNKPAPSVSKSASAPAQPLQDNLGSTAGFFSPKTGSDLQGELRRRPPSSSPSMSFN